MTNEMIILHESVKLMEQGKLKGTGVFITVEVNGEEKQLEVPEEIHTFNGWKDKGYRVKKGEHSTIKFPIWKYTERKKDDDEEKTDASMFMKLSAFFTAEQVELA